MNENIINEEFPLYTNGTSKRLIRHDFFKRLKYELQTYLLGFIASDGSINEERHTLSININKQDYEILELFKIISPEAYCKQQKSYESKALVRGHTVKNHGSIKLSIASKIITDSLKVYGIVQNKTYKEMSIPTTLDNLIKHFIRGYFDGDGCFTYSIRKPSKANREINYRVSARWEICSKKSNILLEIQKYLAKYEITTNINYNKRDDMYSIRTCSREQIIKIYNLLFKDSKYFLSRKYNKLKYYVNTEVVQIIRDHRNAQVMNDRESNNLPTSTEVDNLYDNDYYENNYYDYL